MMNAIDAIRKKHADCTPSSCLVAIQIEDDMTFHDADCDARVVLGALDAERLAHDKTMDIAQRDIRDRDAARADADRLAEAHELAAAVTRLAETGKVEPHVYHENAVYHALVNRIYRGTPPDAMLEGK